MPLRVFRERAVVSGSPITRSSRRSSVVPHRRRRPIPLIPFASPRRMSASPPALVVAVVPTSPIPWCARPRHSCCRGNGGPLRELLPPSPSVVWRRPRHPLLFFLVAVSSSWAVTARTRTWSSSGRHRARASVLKVFTIGLCPCLRVVCCHHAMFFLLAIIGKTKLGLLV